MAFEKRLAELTPRSLTADGTTGGQLQIDDAFLLRVKQTIYLKSNSVTSPLKLQVKRVISPTTFFVGPIGDNIDSRTDVSAFLVADAAFIFNVDPYQPRVDIDTDDFLRAVYDEEPVVAIRTIMVDRGGRYIGSDPDSPFYVQLTDGSVNIGTVHAQLEMFLSHRDNDPDAGDVHSSVRVGDGVETIAVNPDGSINVVVQDESVAAAIKNTYNEVSSVPTSTPTLLVSHTAAVGKVTMLQKVYVSGDNIAKYKVKLNGTNIELLRTYFGGALNAQADFGSQMLTVGDVVTVEVEHQRPDVGDFNGRIQVSEV